MKWNLIWKIQGFVLFWCQFNQLWAEISYPCDGQCVLWNYDGQLVLSCVKILNQKSKSSSIRRWLCQFYFRLVLRTREVDSVSCLKLLRSSHWRVQQCLLRTVSVTKSRPGFYPLYYPVWNGNHNWYDIYWQL